MGNQGFCVRNSGKENEYKHQNNFFPFVDTFPIFFLHKQNLININHSSFSQFYLFIFLLNYRLIPLNCVTSIAPISLYFMHGYPLCMHSQILLSPSCQATDINDLYQPIRYSYHLPHLTSSFLAFLLAIHLIQMTPLSYSTLYAFSSF